MIVTPTEAKPTEVRPQKGRLVPAPELTQAERLGIVRFYGDLEEVRYASVFFRVWAWIVDVIVFGLITIGIGALSLYFFYLGQDGTDCRSWHLPFGRVYLICQPEGVVFALVSGAAVAALAVLYFTGLVRALGRTGQTLGHRARRIRVMDRRTHCPIGVTDAARRFLTPVALLGGPSLLRYGGPWLTERVVVSEADLAYFKDLCNDWADVGQWVGIAVVVLGTLWMLVDRNSQTLWDKIARSIVVQEPPAAYR